MEEEEEVSALEESLLEVLADEHNVAPYKDVIMAQLSFSLKQASLKLLKSDQNLLFDFEFNEVKVDLENRPRTRSYKFELTLGSFHLRDVITPQSLFPLLISPQNISGAPLNTGELKRIPLIEPPWDQSLAILYLF